MDHKPPRDDWSANRRLVEAVLRDDRPATGDALAALALVADLRADLDEVEQSLLALARRGGATWQEVAAALGLRSRQAAEQRWLRLRALTTTDLAAQRRRRQQDIDIAEPEIDTLRARARTLDKRLARLPGGTDRSAALVRLARRTLQDAVDAPPGPMHDLVRLAVKDLRAIPAQALGRPVAEAVERLSALIPDTTGQ